MTAKVKQVKNWRRLVFFVVVVVFFTWTPENKKNEKKTAENMKKKKKKKKRKEKEQRKRIKMNNLRWSQNPRNKVISLLNHVTAGENIGPKSQRIPLFSSW